MTLDTTPLDVLCDLIVEQVDPDQLIDLLNLEIEDVVELCRSHIANADPDTWSFLYEH